jgi:hypothetical protein
MKKNGFFSVKSAYKLAIERRSNNNLGTSTSANRILFFKKKPIGFFMQYGNPGAAKHKKIFI